MVPDTRRTKSATLHTIAQSSSSSHTTGQNQFPSIPFHTAKTIPNSHVDHSHSSPSTPVAPASIGINVVTSLTSSNMAKTHDLSVTHHAMPSYKKPFLASFVSIPAQPQHLDPARQKMLERANKARLYFLRQSGPNKFLIGGDSYDSRFHVNIGPQVRN